MFLHLSISHSVQEGEGGVHSQGRHPLGHTHTPPPWADPPSQADPPPTNYCLEQRINLHTSFLNSTYQRVSCFPGGLSMVL